MFSVWPIMVICIQLSLVGGLLYLIHTWVNRSINVRKEQNEILKALVDKLGNGGK